MAKPVAADISAFAPELASEGDPRITLMIDYAAEFMNETKWGSRYKFGLILLTCHILTVGRRNGAAGSIASESLGDHSISFSTPDSNEFLQTSHYGQQYVALRRTLGISPQVL
jgi:hypothetical protein